MTTDPRIAPLAEALEYIDVRYQGIFSSASGPGPNDLAAAILAALPSGWCGHEDEDERKARWDALIRLRNEDEAEIARLNETLNSEIAEIATLRAQYAAQLNLTIEAESQVATLRAALTIADTTAANLHDEIRDRDAEIARLRAELEAWRHPDVAPSTPLAAELIRLRAIEEAARAYLRHDGSGIKRTDQWAGDWDAMAASSARHALRAALEAER